MNDIESRVARGIALLDSKSPAWRTMIDRDNLNMSDRVACIIGQVFDVQDNTEIGNECFVQYREAVSALGLASGTEHASGFDLSPSEYDTYWVATGPTRPFGGTWRPSGCARWTPRGTPTTRTSPERCTTVAHARTSCVTRSSSQSVVNCNGTLHH